MRQKGLTSVSFPTAEKVFLVSLGLVKTQQRYLISFSQIFIALMLKA